MRGFTLIELILVMGILAVIAGLSIPFFQTFQVSTDLSTYANNVTQTLRRAHQESIAGKNNSAWGVYFDNAGKKFILFQGQDYATRDQSFDLETIYPEIFSVSTDFTNFSDEVYFILHSGQPSTAGTIIMTGPNNESKTISISSYGLVQISN